MAYQFTKIPEKDLAKGIDARSSQDSIKQGYSEDLQNVDTNPNGYLAKRTGYEGYYGGIPLRVASIERSTALGTSFRVVLDSDANINTAFLASSPVILQGRMSSTAQNFGDWSHGGVPLNDSVHWYPSFTAYQPITWSNGEVNTWSVSDNGLTAKTAMIGTLESTGFSGSKDNQQIFADVTRINNTTFDIEHDTVLAADEEVFLFAEDATTVADASYAAQFATSFSGTGTTNISQATHGLTEQNFIIQVYEEEAVTGEDELVIPDSVVVTSSTGNVAITMTNSGSAKDYRVVMLSASLDNSWSEILPNGTSTHQITGVTRPFNFFSLYTSSAGTLTQVIPDNIAYDESAQTLTWTINNSTGSNQTYVAYWVPDTVTSNTLLLTDAGGVSGTSTWADTDCQLTLWGIPHSELYSSTLLQEGHVTHIDTYRREGEERLIAGLGGNIFSARTHAEESTNFAIPSNTVDLEADLNADTDLAPAFGRTVAWTDAAVTAAATFTVTTIDDNCSATAHGLTTQDPLVVSSTTTIPAGLAASTTYYAIVVDDDNFKLASSAANALARIPVDITSTGSGTHTFTPNGLTISSHGFNTNDPVKFTEASGTLPTNLNTTDIFYVTAVNDNVVNISTLAGGTALAVTGAVAGTYGMKIAWSRSSGTGPAIATSVDREGTALVTAATFSAENTVLFTLSLAGNTVDVSDMLSVTSPVNDRLTVSGMAKSANNGTFVITAVDDSDVTAPVFTCTVPGVKLAAQVTETGARGRGGIFTDTLTLDLAANNDYIPGDIMVAQQFNNFTCTVKGVSSDSVLIDGVTDEILLLAGYRLYAKRTTDVIPMVGSNDNSDALAAGEGVEGFVRHDMLTVTNLATDTTLANNPRIKYINSDADNALNGAADTSTVGSITMTLTSNHNLRTGQKILLLRTGVAAYDGIQTITAVPAANKITFATSDTTGTSTGTVRGDTLEIDEELTITDGESPTNLKVTGRWVPIESPYSTDELAPATTPKYLDSAAYNAQDIVRSTTVGNNMYFTNYADEVFKFDGTDLYQAGLFRWQPGVFASISTSGSILAGDVTASINAKSATSVTLVTAGHASFFNVGDYVEHSADNARYYITDIDETNRVITLDATVSGAASGTISRVDQYRYYFRLHALDANNNNIASATTSSQDMVVNLVVDSDINIKLTQFPDWNYYDYDALELQVYRTRKNTSGPFYLIKTLDLDFDRYNSYIDFVDNTPDTSLPEAGSATNDPVTLGISGGTALGNTWTGPLRGKYITSLDNRLILGNVKDYPELDITLFQKPLKGTIPASDLGGLIIRFDKDNTDAGTTTDMINRVNYEFLTSGANTITPASDISTGTNSFTIDNGGAHGLEAGDWVYMFHFAAGDNNDLDFAGWWQVYEQSGGTTFSVRYEGHSRGAGGGDANDVDRWVKATAPEDVPVWLGTDGNYNQLGYSTASDEGIHVQRLAQAINASMRAVNEPEITAMNGFVPWITANAGSEYGFGQIVVRQDKVDSTALSVTTPAAPTNGNWYVNGVIANATETSASTRVFNSRVIVSYPNFPEIFDNPWGDPSLSDSAIDVNSADGQEITGIIPFFGEAAFGASQIESTLVVFKTNSIYLVNVTTRQIQKIQSYGLGCTAPYSIAYTKDGIMFANESGIYKLGRDQSVTYVGEYMERLWQDDVDLDNLSVATGHHDSRNNKYKLSLPVGDSQTTNNRVYVYDHTREGRGQEHGAWTQYTNHHATGWANKGKDSFWASTDGNVFKVRNNNDTTDYRDNDSAVAEMVILTRGNDFGQPSIRKIVGNVTSHFQMRRSSMVGTQLQSSADLDGVFADAGTFTMTKDSTIKIDQAVSSIARRRMVQLQLKYTNSTKDEDVVLTGIDYNVTGLSEKGVQDQAETD